LLLLESELRTERIFIYVFLGKTAGPE